VPEEHLDGPGAAVEGVIVGAGDHPVLVLLLETLQLPVQRQDLALAKAWRLEFFNYFSL